MSDVRMAGTSLESRVSITITITMTITNYEHDPSTISHQKSLCPPRSLW